MSLSQLQLKLLQEFERGLDPQHPARSRISVIFCAMSGDIDRMTRANACGSRVSTLGSNETEAWNATLPRSFPLDNNIGTELCLC